LSEAQAAALPDFIRLTVHRVGVGRVQLDEVACGQRRGGARHTVAASKNWRPRPGRWGVNAAVPPSPFPQGHRAFKCARHAVWSGGVWSNAGLGVVRESTLWSPRYPIRVSCCSCDNVIAHPFGPCPSCTTPGVWCAAVQAAGGVPPEGAAHLLDPVPAHRSRLAQRERCQGHTAPQRAVLGASSCIRGFEPHRRSCWQLCLKFPAAGVAQRPYLRTHRHPSCAVSPFQAHSLLLAIGQEPAIVDVAAR
jgi:hypothetical protein